MNYEKSLKTLNKKKIYLQTVTDKLCHPHKQSAS